MGMTKLEQAAKQQIIKKLRSQGYVTYATLLDLFDVNLTADPNVVAYMIPDKAVIVINKFLEMDQVSTIVRHEILHEYLAHRIRIERHIGKDQWDKRSPVMHQIMNIAGDYEISNRGYTSKDKDIARGIKLGDQVLKGLVTEDDHPDWYDEATGEGKSFEEMYDLLIQEYEKDKEEFEKAIKQYMKDLMDGMGDSEIQRAEEIAREAQIAKEIAEDAAKGDGEGSEDAQAVADQAKDIEDAANDAKKEAEKQQKGKKSSKGAVGNDPSGEVFDDPEAREKARQLKIRLDKIEKAFNDLAEKSDLIDEIDTHKRNDRVAKAEKDMNQYKADPTHAFQASLNDFVKRILGIERGPSWSRPNRRYAGTGIYNQGKAIKQKPIPVINMYFDQSGSWSNDGIILGNKCVSVLNSYVRQGKIKLKLYYFSNNVHDEARKARAEGGTEGQPIMDHIKATRPDNVIILTDSDISDIRDGVKVPGAVWLLFRDSYRSQNLINSIKGEKLTKIFDINRAE